MPQTALEKNKIIILLIIIMLTLLLAVCAWPHIWSVAVQLLCGDRCQVQMWQSGMGERCSPLFDSTKQWYNSNDDRR